MPTSTFQEQGTVTLVPVASLPEERRCQSLPGRACVLDGWPSSSLPYWASSARAPLNRFRRWCEKRHGTGLLLLRQVSEAKRSNSLSPSATRNTESNVASSIHVLKTSSAKKGFLSTGKLTDTATGIAVDEKPLISWARMTGQKNEEDRTCQFRSWSSKSQSAKMMHDLLQPTEIALPRRRSSSVAHLYVCLGSRLKSLGQQSRSPSLCLIFTRRLLSRDRDRRRNWPCTERRQKVSDVKSKKSVRSSLQNTVGRVSRSRDLFLFGLRHYIWSLLNKLASLWHRHCKTLVNQPCF